jgi:hypothetical protein
MDWDEELKRQAAISALLASPEDDSTDALPDILDIPDVVEPKSTSEFHKLVDQHFDTKTDEQVTALPPEEKPPAAMAPGLGAVEKKVYPTIAEDQGQPDQPKLETKVDEAVIPYDEREKPAPPESPYHPLDTGKGAAPEAYPTIAQDQGAGEGSGQQAPDALTQVERATLVKLPPEVRRAELIDPDPDSQYLEPEVRRAAKVGETPKAEPTQDPLVTRSIAQNIAARAAPAPAPAQPAVSAPAGVIEPKSNSDFEDLINQQFGGGKTTTSAGADTSGQDNTGQADYFRKRGDAPITSENDPRLTQINVGGSKWNVHQEAAPYFKGFLQELADQGAPMRSDGGWNYRQKVGAKGLSEHSWGGAIDVNQDGRGVVTPAFQKWIQDHPGALQAAEAHWHIYGGERFGDLGHFEWGGVGGPASTAGGQGGGGDVLAQLQSHGLNVTTYGQADDPYGDPDSLAGRGKYIQNLIPGYDVALNNAAWNLVGRPKPGQEFQFGGRTFRYGDQVPEKYSDARFDVFDPYKTALSSLGKGQAAAPKNEWDNWQPATQEDLQSGRNETLKILGDLSAKNQNPAAFLKLLEQPISGVSDENRQLYAERFKAELTKYAQDYYHEPDAAKAFARATGDPGFLGNTANFIENTWKGMMQPVAQADLGLNEMSKNSDFQALDKFAKVLHPESDGPGRAAFIKTLTDIQDPTVRSQAIGKLWAQLDPDRQAAIDINGLVQAADNVSSPEYQAAQNQAITVKQNFLDKLREADPTLKGTPGEWWSGQIGSFLTNAAITAIPPLRTSAFGAQLYEQDHEKIKAEHPEWTEDQVSTESAKTAFLQQAPQEVLMALAERKMGPLAAWISKIQNPVLRATAGGAIHTAVGATMGTVQQIGENVGMNRPTFENVPQAALTGAGQALPFGVIGGVHALVSPHVEAPPPVQEPAEPPLPPTPPTPATGPEGAPIRGPTEETLTRPEVPLTPAHVEVQQDLINSGMDAGQVEKYVSQAQGTTHAEVLNDVQTQMREDNILPSALEPRVSEADPSVSRIANRYTAERMATGELGPVDPSEGQSTEQMVMRGLTMAPEQRERLINNLVRGVGGDLDTQGAAIRSKELILSEQSRSASQAARAEPDNPQLKAQAQAALAELTAFHNGPVKKFKRVWSDAGRGLQREIPVDFTTLNGMKEAYLKAQGKEAPAGSDAKFQKVADAVSKSAIQEQAAMSKLGQEIEARTRGNPVNDEAIRTKLMEMTKDLPCRT